MLDWNRTTPLRAAMGATLLALALPASADVRLNGDFGIGFDDNVGNAAEDIDARESAVVSGAVNADYRLGLTPSLGLLLRGGMQGEAYESEGALSNARALLMTRLSFRPVGGFHMPTFGASIAGALNEYDSAMRDGFDYRAGLHVIEPLTTALSLRLAVGATERRGDSEVFDLSSWNAGLDLDWQVMPAFTLYAGYQYQDGDVVSSGTVVPKSSHLPGGAGIATAADPDDAIDGQFAYRIDATTHVTTLGFNLPLSGRLSVDGQVRRIDSGATAGETSYERLQGVVSVLMSL